MTDDQLSVPFRNEQTISTNSCECTNRNVAFDLETYGPRLDKIRELFVPSLEYRIHSLLEEFVYNGDSRWAVQFPYFKKFVDAIVTWRDPLIKAAEYDIGTMQKAIRSIVERVMKDDLVTCFLDSITLYYRLNKICRELDALGIEDNILRSLNVWNFVNEKEYQHRVDRDCFTNLAGDSSDVTMSSFDAKELARCKKAIESANIIDANRDFHARQTEDDSTRDAAESQNDDKVVESVNEEPREFAKTQSFGKGLKMIVRRTYPENCCPTLSGCIVTRLASPCKPSDLIGRIFEADPSLTESCFIVMKRKFLTSVHHVCSCLNDILGKLDVEFTRTLYLDCEIYPGYIRFRLKSDNVNKCLFVARIPICQNVRRRTLQRNCIVSTCKSRLTSIKDAKESNSEGRDDDKDTLARVDEEGEELDDTCCSRSDRNVRDTMNTSRRDETENGNKEAITCSVTECLEDFRTFCWNKSRENVVAEMCDVTSHVDNSEEREGRCRNIVDSMEMDRENEGEKSRRGIFDSGYSIDSLTNDDSTRLIEDAGHVRSSSDNSVETNHEVGNIFSNGDPEDFSQHDETRSPDEESLGDEDRDANTCSIASFVQNSEHDKQLVELNCNRFLDNDIAAIDKRSKDEDDSLNSAKVEVGCDSRCCSSENNDSLTVSVQTSRIRVSSKGISVNVSYPRAVVWLASGDDRSVSTKKEYKVPRDKKVSGKTKAFLKPSRRFLVPRSRPRSNEDSTEGYLCVTSDSSRCCRSTRKLSTSDRDGFGRSHRSMGLSKLRVSSSNAFPSVTSFAAIKYGAASLKDNDYSAKVRPQAILVMTKFRDSIDRSVGRIKRLIHAKLGKILFNAGIKTSESGTFWKNEESSKDTRGRTNGRCVRQGYSITSCSTCNCCRHSCTLSSRDCRLIGGSETLSTFRSMEASYDSSTPAVEGLEEHESSRSDRCDRRERIARDIIRKRNSCHLRNYRTSLTISSRSAKAAGNDSRYTCEQREETRDDKRVDGRTRNQDRWKEERREMPIKSSARESLEASLSYTRGRRVRNVRRRSRSRTRNARGFAGSSGHGRSRKKRVLGILTDVRNDCADDLEQDFKLHLLRYVQLCRSVKRALARTLRPDDDFYGVEWPLAT